MEVKILHLYSDIMNLYGEYGNTLILKKHLEDCACEVSITGASFDDKACLNDFDFIYMGSGTELAQKKVLKDIKKYKRELAEAVNNNKVMLFTGNSFEILGKAFTDKNDSKKTTDGLNIFDFITEENFEKRQTSDVICECSFLKEPLVGFINKCTENKNIDSSLFKIKYSNLKESTDGIIKNNFFGTHLIGPILVKNPDFLEFIIKKIFEYKNEKYISPENEYIYEKNSYYITLKELKNNFIK